MFSLGFKLITVGRVMLYLLFNDINFAWLEVFTVLFNNTMNLLFNKFKHYFIFYFFIKCFWISIIKLILIILLSAKKSCTYPVNLVFFMLLAVKSLEIFPKHNSYGFISESFALNWYTFVALTNKKLLLPLYIFFGILKSLKNIPLLLVP